MTPKLNLLMAAAVVAITLTSIGIGTAEAQGGGFGTGGSIVNGRHLQPTLSDIMERQALRPPGQRESAPPSRGPDPADKELDELYYEVLKQSQPPQ